MQKWLPDSFGSDGATATAVLHTDDAIFEAEDTAPGDPLDDKNRLFMSESGFSGPEAIMAHLTREERAQVFELVEQDIAKVYEDQEVELRTKLEADLDEARQGFDTALATFSVHLKQAMENHIKETADASARLATQLAEKIVRKKVSMDQEILARAIETALFKIEGTKSITVSVNPGQAEWLEAHDGVREKLGIQEIVSDRRIEPGGCLLKTEKQEWDATVSGQLKYLSELVEEMIITGDAPDLSGEEGTDAKPDLD